MTFSGRRSGWIASQNKPLITTTNISIPLLQLDLFEHSGDVILRNAAIDALRQRDAAAGARALTALGAEYSTDPLLPALDVLCRRLHTPLPNPIARQVAIEILRETEGIVGPAAKAVFGRGAPAWLAAFWVDVGAAIAHFPFDSGDEALHVAPLLLRAGE